MTANAFITGALKMLGVCQASETPATADLTDGLTVLNEMVEAWRNERLMLYRVAREVQPLTANTANYAIGPGAAWSIAYIPSYLEGVSFIYDDSADPIIETPVSRPISREEYQAISDKTMAGLPDRVYFEPNYHPTFAQGTVWPVPETNNIDIVLYVPASVTQFADGTTDYTFTAGYKRAIRTNLAIELAPYYTVIPTPTLEKLARTSKYRIQAKNVVVPEMRIDPSINAFRGSAFNIYAGE